MVVLGMNYQTRARWPGTGAWLFGPPEDYRRALCGCEPMVSGELCCKCVMWSVKRMSDCGLALPRPRDRLTRALPAVEMVRR